MECSLRAELMKMKASKYKIQKTQLLGAMALVLVTWGVAVATPVHDFGVQQRKDFEAFRSGVITKSQLLELSEHNERKFFGKIRSMIPNINYSIDSRVKAAKTVLAMLELSPDPTAVIFDIEELINIDGISVEERLRLSEFLFSHGLSILDRVDLGRNEKEKIQATLRRSIETLTGENGGRIGDWRMVAFYQGVLRFARLVNDKTLFSEAIGRGKSTALGLIKAQEDGALRKTAEEVMGVYLEFLIQEYRELEKTSSMGQVLEWVVASLNELEGVPELRGRIVQEFFSRLEFTSEYRRALFLEKFVPFFRSAKSGQPLFLWLYSFYVNRGDKINEERIKRMISNYEEIQK